MDDKHKKTPEGRALTPLGSELSKRLDELQDELHSMDRESMVALAVKAHDTVVELAEKDPDRLAWATFLAHLVAPLGATMMEQEEGPVREAGKYTIAYTILQGMKIWDEANKSVVTARA